MKRLSVILSLTIALFLVCNNHCMEEPRVSPQPEAVQEIALRELAVPPLLELATETAADGVFLIAKTPMEIKERLLELPSELRVPVGYYVIKSERYKGTPQEALALAYQLGKDAGPRVQKQLDALFDEAIKKLDPCEFVNTELTALLPGYQEKQFTLRDERLIKAIVRKPGWKLSERYIKFPKLSGLTGVEYQTNTAISPDGSKIAVGLTDNTLLAWSIQDNKPLALFRSPVPFTRFRNPLLTWSSDSRLLTLGADDGSVHFWDVAAMEPPQVRLRLSGMSQELHEDIPNRNQQALFAEQHAKLPAKDVRWLERLSRNPEDALQNQNVLSVLTIEPETSRYVTWYILRATNVRSRIHFMADAEGNGIYSLSYSPDGNFLTTVSNNNHRVRVWDVRGIYEKDAEALAAMRPEFDRVFAARPVVAMLSNGAKRLAVAPVADHVVVLDLETGREIANLPTDGYGEGYAGLGAGAIGLSADGMLLGYTDYGNYYLYDLNKKTFITGFSRGHVAPTQIFSPGNFFEGDGGFVACVAAEEEHPLLVYALRFGGNVKVLLSPNDYPESFSANGKWFVTSADPTNGAGRINIWQLPLDYLLGNLTWQELRDALARKCLQIAPVKEKAEEDGKAEEVE